jgi:mannitol-1-phosphate 5-dehydrogenase
VLKRAVHFGAGNIGRGFLGQLYFESGYFTTFVDVVDDVVFALQRHHAYPIRIVEETSETRLIEHVGAIHGRDIEAVAEAITTADLASTAVGVNALPYIAPAIARGIERRFADPSAPPLNFIVCENLIEAGPYMREQVRAHLSPAFHEILDAQVGFVEASIGRMVPVMPPEQLTEDPLLVCVEAYCELPVDATAFKGSIPELRHLKPAENFGAYVERKLYVHNLSHAATAYLGYLRGHEYIWQAIRDDRVRTEVEAAADESCDALARKHGMDRAGLEAHRDDLVRRYHNRALGDQVSRVARDPVRKLGPRDRLIGAGRLCLEQQLHPDHIAFAVAAAMRYDLPGDPAAQFLQNLFRRNGAEGVFREICQMTSDEPLARLVIEQTGRLQQDHWSRQE